MRRENGIVCRPPQTPVRHWFLIVCLSLAFPGAFILAGLVIVSELATGYQTPVALKWIFAAVSAVSGVALMMGFLRWEQDRWYWILEDDRLIGGRKGNRVFPLSSVTALVPGLPDETNPLVAANRVLNRELWEALMEERRMALVIRFADGAVLPLHLHKCVNGRLLMTELVRRLEDRIDFDYTYTPREIRALRSADWNRIVKQ